MNDDRAATLATGKRMAPVAVVVLAAALMVATINVGLPPWAVVFIAIGADAFNEWLLDGQRGHR
jgi:hypothetical protein